MRENISEFFKSVSKDIPAILFTAWFFVNSVYLYIYKGEITVSTFRDSNIFIFIFSFLLFAGLLMFFAYKIRSVGIIQIMLTVSVAFFSAVSLTFSQSFSLVLALLGVAYIAVRYAAFSGKRIFFTPGKTVLCILPAALVFLFAFITGYVSVLRHVCYSTYTYDAGIFNQMFYSMKTTFLPNTTCERNGLLSHFAVHLSPIYYLLLPVYAIFPSPVTLSVMQVLVLFSGIIPLFLIMRHYSLDRLTILLTGGAFCAFPAISAGCLYDIHENCFLLPLLLWMIYFFEKKKTALFFIFAFLVLLVKEDAFIYPAVFGIYLISSKRDIKKGLVLIGGAGIYFGFACFIINSFGEGIMAGRYENLTVGGESLLGVLRTIITNPLHFLSQLFITKDKSGGKIIYFICLLAPLAMVPCFTKKPSRWILASPILLNLMTLYGYQYRLNFQYNFGITAFLFYLTVMNLADSKKPVRNYRSFMAFMAAIIIFISVMYPEVHYYTQKYTLNKDTYARMTEILEEIPEDASVCSSGYLVCHLTERAEIYDAKYNANTDADYYVEDLRPNYIKESSSHTKAFTDAGYELAFKEDGLVAIYKKR